MKTVKVMIDKTKIGVVPVSQIELAYVVHEITDWMVRMRLTSGYEVTSVKYDDRAKAETALRSLFLDT